LTPNSEGVDYVVEVGGPLTIATKLDGVISIIGFLAGGAEHSTSFIEILSRGVLVRGVLVGSRQQFEEMVDGPTVKYSVTTTNSFRIELLWPIILSLSSIRRFLNSMNLKSMYNDRRFCFTR
jgi:hypothetical protein